MEVIDWNSIIVGIKGAGEMATGVAVRLKRAGFSRIFMMETEYPLAVRRTVSFCEAIHDGKSVVEGIEAVRTKDESGIFEAWEKDQIAINVDPCWTFLTRMHPQVVIDAIIAKRNLGTTLGDAALVIGLGPGFTAQVDVHRVIETMRGHDLGRVIDKGSALADTGIPGSIGGHTMDRVLRAPVTGTFHSERKITDPIKAGDRIGDVDGRKVVAEIDGVLRGLIRKGTLVRAGIKIGDIDPRGCVEYCSTVSDKSRAIGGAVLEAILGASRLLVKRSSR
jgi:xanthine dehydrogenase accessory factor